MATLDIKTWNKKGTKDNFNYNFGSLTAFVDRDDNYIHIDTKNGSGDDHTEREQCEILIVKDGSAIFTGSFTQLKNKLLPDCSLKATILCSNGEKFEIPVPFDYQTYRLKGAAYTKNWCKTILFAYMTGYAHAEYLELYHKDRCIKTFTKKDLK